MNIHPGMTLYYLNRDCYNPNQTDHLIIPLKVKMQTDTPIASSVTEAASQLLLPLTPELIVQYTDTRYPVLFTSYEKAKSTYDNEIKGITSRISRLNAQDLIRELNLTKKPFSKIDEEVIKKLYDMWKEAGSALPCDAEIKAMKDRIREVFKVSV